MLRPRASKYFQTARVGNWYGKKKGQTEGEKKKPLMDWDGELVCDMGLKKVKEEESDGSLGDCMQTQPRVLIVGAGMAGLSAGQRLARAGLTDFLIVDGTNRIGGRINSAWSGEAINEWGAEWLEGEWNPVLRLAALECLNQCSRLREPVYLAPDGRPIEGHVVNQTTSAFKQIRQQAAALFSLDNSEDGPLDYFMDSKVKELGLFGRDSRRLMHSLKESTGVRWGTRPKDMSARYFGSYIECSERKRLKEGMLGVLAPLIRDIPESNICLCKPVRLIDWTCPKITVTFCDDTSQPADFVIVTCSLGVLKANKDLFLPPIPDPKQTAIETLGYGTVNKVFLDYKDAFWLKDEGSLFFAQEEVQDWKSTIYSVEEVCNGKNTLEFSVAGQHAIDLEQIDEDTIAKEATMLFREFTGVRTLPFPIGVTRTKWSLDPLFEGSVSYVAHGSSVTSQCDLGAPLPGPGIPAPPRLLFAGEATIPGYFGTVEGARLSGFREAERIISLTLKQGGAPLG